jgi:hypothetical protein
VNGVIGSSVMVTPMASATAGFVLLVIYLVAQVA